MAYIIETLDPFDPLKHSTKHHVNPGLSIRDWLEITHSGFVEFEQPTICLLNGKAILRKDWVHTIQDEDVVVFLAVPQGPYLIIAAVIVAVIALSVALVLTVQAPVTPGETPASDPVFSTRGQQNAIRLGEPIEVCYGRNRIYPALASRPYFQYKDNDQFQYSLFCLGHGYFDIDEIRIGDTDIDSFQEVQYEVYDPGEAPTLFPTNVSTSAEAGGQVLFASNEPEYSAPGWVGPFVANPSGTDAYELQVDVVFLKGLYETNSDGGLDAKSITYEIEYREIDDAGAPVGLGTWLPFTSPFPRTTTGATTTPQRRTISKTVTAARYEVRMRRTDTKDTSFRSGHEIAWEGLRSYITTTPTFGSVTLLAVIIRATNNLNDRTALKFNVIATRMLEIRDHTSGIWSAPAVTRSIIWATVDAFRANYGGRLADEFFDWDALDELDTLYETRGDHFDWIFRDPITVWDAARAICRAGRAVPILAGSLITIVRDGPLTVPVGMFNKDNIIDKSFNHDVKLWDPDEYDSIRVEYTEVATDYSQETVMCVLPGGTTDHPQDVRLVGVQDRTQAYREGLYMLAQQRYLRDNYTFDTGLEGHIPTFGDLVVMQNDIVRGGHGHGFVVHAEQNTDERCHLWLSEPLDWTTDSGEHVLMLRAANGDVLGPFTAYQTSDPKQVQIDIADTDFDFLLGGQNEPMLFMFGILGTEGVYCKVVKVEPQGGEIVRIVAVNEDSRIHSFDELEPPALEETVGPPEVPDLPEIDSMTITQIDGTLRIIQVAWTAAFGAQYYIVQTSEDGENWQNRGNTVRTNVQLQVRPGHLWVRVAGVNTGQGPWIEDDLVIGSLNELFLFEPWENIEWGISWWDVLNASGYQISVYDNSASVPVLKNTFLQDVIDKDFVYDYTQAVSDSNLVREMLVEVDVLFEEGASGFPVSLEVSNAIPSPPTGPLAVLLTVDSDSARYTLTWNVPAEEDLITVKVWASAVSGFDPSVDVSVYSFTAGAPASAGIPETYELDWPLDSFGGHGDIYWRVGLFDVWGNEISTNLTAEQHIPAMP